MLTHEAVCCLTRPRLGNLICLLLLRAHGPSFSPTILVPFSLDAFAQALPFVGNLLPRWHTPATLPLLPVLPVWAQSSLPRDPLPHGLQGDCQAALSLNGSARALPYLHPSGEKCPVIPLPRRVPIP